MAATIPVILGDRTVTVRTLTVREIYDWQASVEARSAAALEAGKGGGMVAYDLALDDCSLHDLARMCDCSADDLAEHTHVELADVVAAARELNPPFFRVRAWMIGQIVGREALALAAAQETSPAPH